MDTWLDKNRGLIFGVLSLLALAGAGVFYWYKPGEAAIEIVAATPTAAEASMLTPFPTATPSPTPAPVRVYVSGAVQQSDVFFLPQGSIIKDAIQAAGGFTNQADPAQINLAMELQDQQQIHVPRKGEEKSLPVVRGGAASNKAVQAAGGSGSASGRINLNTASLEELDTLPGIGPAIAQRIIEFRESLGGFTSPDQITEVSGIGDATFTKIASRISVE